MRGVRRTVALVAFGAALAPPCRAGDEPFAPCEAAVRARPADRDAWACFEIVGQAPARRLEGTRRLDARRAARPGDPFPQLALGRLEAGFGGERAAALLSAAAEGFARLGDAVGEAQALAALARFEGFRGRKAEAVRAADALRRVAARASDPEPAFQALVVEALFAQWARDYGKAWTLLAEADPGLYTTGSLMQRRGALAGLAYVAWATGRPEQAAAAYRRLMTLLHESGDRYREAAVASDLLSVMSNPSVATRDELRTSAEDLVVAAQSSGNIAAEATALAYLADVEGPSRTSAERVARALDLARQGADPRVLRMVLAAKALYASPDDEAAAEAALGEALSAVDAAQDLDGRARLLVVRSRRRWLTGPRADAIAASETALDAAERTRDEQPDSLTRARRFAQWSRPYLELSGRLLSGALLPDGTPPTHEDVERAFATLERMRARVLLDEMDASSTSAELFAGGGAGRRRDDALKRLAAARQQARELSPADPARAAALAEVARLEREAAALREEVLRANPAFAAVRAPVFPSLTELQARLAPDEALFEYVVRETAPGSQSWGAVSGVLVVARDAIRWTTLPLDPSLGDRVVLLGDLIVRRSGDEGPAAARLYDEVLRPALALVPRSVRRVVVVPDRILHGLPFAALRAESGRPFGDTFDVTVVPSATVWWRERLQSPASGSRGILAFVDAGAGVTGGSSPVRDAPERPPLAWAAREGASAARRAGRRSRVLSGADAVEAVLAGSEPARYRVLHFAAHALLDHAHPERSAIVLAPGTGSDDGLLHLREIAALKVPGSVVVLSGCRSAGGPVLAGEGPIGLARAFFQAGARAVVGSVFPLRDDEAAAFFDRFYAHLAEGTSVAGAVRLAQRDRRRAGAPTAAWAGIVALGDGGAVPFPEGTERWPMLLGLGFGAVAAGGLAWRLRRRARASRI